jgi:hypothetical protein
VDPFKVYFQQKVDLDSRPPVNKIYLEGVEKYLRHHVINEIPSASESSVWCSDHGIRRNLRSCRWSGELPAIGNGSQYSDLVKFTATRLDAGWVRFTVKGPEDTRACRIYFDSAVVHSLRVHGASNNGTEQKGYEIPDSGLASVLLWSRTWGREWVVDIGLESKTSTHLSQTLLSPKSDDGDKLTGRVACEWSENIDSRIPALEEVMTFIPQWAVVTKADDGLVEAYKAFEI